MIVGTRAARLRTEAGMTLVELLAAISILGIISFALTEAIIVGLRTSDKTAATIAGSITSQSVASFFSGDVQSSEHVSTDDSTCAEQPVFIRFSWTDRGVGKTASYALDPPTGNDQALVRWSCEGASDPARKVLGHFSRNEGADPPAVTVTCAPNPCTSLASAPREVTLTVYPRPDFPPEQLTVARRTA